MSTVIMEIVQHIEYVPFGEVFIEERNTVWNTPYLFNAIFNGPSYVNVFTYYGGTEYKYTKMWHYYLLVKNQMRRQDCIIIYI